MEIVINGQTREARDGQSVLALLEELGLDPGRLALELDGRILKQKLWGETALHPGARLEIVHFVGGG
jgi:thiamine biosynthesis protein ThiS